MNAQPTAEEFRALAKQATEERAASWERSDSDGFLSQWASGVMANRYLDAAQVADDGWKVNRLALFFNGKLASNDQRDGQYGFYWILNDEAAEAYGKRFYSPSKAKRGVRADRLRGFTYGTIRVDAFWSSRKGQIFEDFTAIKEGRFEIIATDGAYASIEADEEAAV